MLVDGSPLADSVIASYTNKSEKLYSWRPNILCDYVLFGHGTDT